MQFHSLCISSQSHSTQAYENFVSCFSQPSKQSPADQKISEWSQTLVENKGDFVLLKTFWKQSPQANRALNSGLCCRFLLKHILATMCTFVENKNIKVKRIFNGTKVFFFPTQKASDIHCISETWWHIFNSFKVNSLHSRITSF